MMSTSAAVHTNLSASLLIGPNLDYSIFKLTGPEHVRVLLANLAKVNGWKGSSCYKMRDGSIEVGYKISKPIDGDLSDEIEKVNIFCEKHKVKQPVPQKISAFDNSQD